MVKLKINLGERSYPIYIETDYSYIGSYIRSARLEGKLVIITDENVDRLQSDEFIKSLNQSGYDAHKYVIEAGEKSKNLDTISEIYKFLVGLKLDRKSTLIALGGGVIGDITGFVAATFLRGIHFVQVPTTLLAQADSSVGGKVGVDFEGHKNIIGAFYQPKFVYMNVNSLRTLPQRDFISGMAEVIKHGIIRDADFFEYIDYNINKIFNFDEDVLRYMAKINCSIKGSVVEEDEKESDLREILNFGHTIGHAIETVMEFKLMHGECVSLGMVGAFKMALKLEMVNEELVDNIIRVLEKIGLPTKLKELDVEKVYNQMFFDKKVKNNKLRFVLPKKVGEIIQLNIDDEELIKSVLEELKV